MKHNNSQPLAVDVGLTVDSSSGRRVEDREHHSNGNKMTDSDEKMRHTISQKQKMLAAIQSEIEENGTNHQGVISTRQVEKLTLSETDKATIEHVLKLRNDFYLEDCPVHEELTNFLCVDCNLKLCAQCGSEHSHLYTSHRIEDMDTLTPSEDREHHINMSSNGNKMTHDKMRHAISQQQKMLAAIQRENEDNSRPTNHQGVISARQVEKLTLSETEGATIEHVLKLRKNFYPEDCPVHEELTNFLCVDCNLKLCAQCGSEHSHSYTSHRIEDMDTLSPRDRNDVDYKETNPGPYTEPFSEGKTAKRCHVHRLFFSFYCQECENLLCELCNEEHQRHYGKQPMPLVNMQREVDAKFERHINEINLMKKKFSEATENATVRIQQLYEQADVLKQKVNTATQQAIDQIRENAEVMIRQIDSEAEKVAADTHLQIDSATKKIETLDEAIDLAENALKNSSESEFVVANFAERQIEMKMRSLDTYQKHHYSYSGSNEIDLECQLNKGLQYSENDGNRSCAPVRLMKSQYGASTMAMADSIWFQRM